MWVIIVKIISVKEDNIVDHLLVSEENVVTTFSKVLCSRGILEITVRDVNQQGVEYGAFAKVTRTEGAAADDGKADDKKKDTKEITEAVPVNLEEKKSATTKINYTAISGKLPIKKGEKGEIVREINIRLMGFGGGLPSDEYNDYTVKVVKQFKEDYMGLKNADGTFVDMATIQAIDKFADEYPITATEFNQMKCPCPSGEADEKCDGFGKGRKELKGKEIFKKYNDTFSYWSNDKYEAYNPYEYPGMHVALFWILRTSKFYLKKENYYVLKISSGYRCWNNNKYARDKKGPTPRGTTNHMGKALDIWIGKNGEAVTRLSILDKIRKNIFNNRMGAIIGCIANNKIYSMELETYKQGAKNWVHLDIRQCGKVGLEDIYFTKEKSKAINPLKLVEIIKKGVK